jgi:ATP synthase protein I
MENKNTEDRNVFTREVEEKAKRKLRAKRNSSQGVWFGLGMMGLIGWSVAIPTLLGAALGIWLDNKYQGTLSWTLTFLIIGLVIGCLNAWHWLGREDREMQEGKENNNE